MDIELLLKQAEDGMIVPLSEGQRKDLHKLVDEGKLSLTDYAVITYNAAGIKLRKGTLPKDWCRVLFRR